jgi:hypothetical protein
VIFRSSTFVGILMIFWSNSWDFFSEKEGKRTVRVVHGGERRRESLRRREREEEREGDRERQGVPKMSSRKKGAGSKKDMQAQGKKQGKLGVKQSTASAGVGVHQKGGLC